MDVGANDMALPIPGFLEDSCFTSSDTLFHSPSTLHFSISDRPFHGLIRHLGYGANHVIDQDGDSLIVNKEVNE